MLAQPVVYPDGGGNQLVEVWRILQGHQLIFDNVTECTEKRPLPLPLVAAGAFNFGVK